MEMLFFGLEVLKDSFVQSTLGLDFEQVWFIPNAAYRMLHTTWNYSRILNNQKIQNGFLAGEIDELDIAMIRKKLILDDLVFAQQVDSAGSDL